jgi:hypothetical protein
VELPSGVHTSSRLARVRVWVSITSGQGGVGGGIRGGAVRRGGRGNSGCARALPSGAGCSCLLPLLLRSALLVVEVSSSSLASSTARGSVVGRPF